MGKSIKRTSVSLGYRKGGLVSAMGRLDIDVLVDWDRIRLRAV